MELNNKQRKGLSSNNSQVPFKRLCSAWAMNFTNPKAVPSFTRKKQFKLSFYINREIGLDGLMQICAIKFTM